MNIHIHQKSPLILQTFIWVPIRLVLKFFVRFEIRGLDNIKNLKKPVIFASNHSSEWDPILVTAALPFLHPLLPMYYASRERSFYDKKGLESLIYGGAFFRLWGAYPVYTGLNNYKKSLVNHTKILNQKKGSLCFFPEGRKTKDGKLQSFKGGVIFLANETNTPIVPVSIKGVFKRSANEFFSRKRKVIVSFGKPLNKEDLLLKEENTPQEYTAHTEIIKSKIEEMLKN
jgi:1-acyl-sn-glycerol-3-phosphate acyltransferase